MSAVRLTAQNYCTSCDCRTKVQGKAICSEYNLPVNDAMNDCSMLKPFKNYKDFKSK